MRLTAIEAQNFLSYEELRLDLSGVSQVVVVGQNGHGKSALLDAILWCLYGEGRGSADQMVRHGALSSWVKVTMEVLGQCVEITRHRSMETKAGESSLHVVVNGVKTTRHTIAETQDQIERIVGLPAKALLAGPIMVQGHSDTLMRARPAERKDLIIRLLDLGRYDQYHAAAKEKLESANREMAVFEARIEDAELQFGEREGLDAMLEDARGHESSARQVVEQATENVAQIREEAVRAAERASRVKELADEMTSANRRLDGWTSALESAERQLVEQTRLAATEAIEPVYAETSEIDLHIEQSTLLAKQTEVAVTEAIALASSRAGLRAEKERLEGLIRTRDERGVCDTCPFVEQVDPGRLQALEAELRDGQDPDVLALRAAAAEYRQKASDWQQERAAMLHSNESAKSGYEKAVQYREMASQMVAQTTDQIATLQEGIDEHNERIRRLASERMRLGDAVDMGALTSRLNEATALLVAAKETLAGYERTLHSAEARLAEIRKLEEQVRTWDEMLGKMRDRADLYALLAKAWHRDGVPTLILENALPTIETRANELLARMPGDFAVRLVTQRAKKVGGMIETLDVVVETEGQERDYDLLSGGERFRVDLALRVALAELLTRRAGTRIQTLWLDEPLAALDANGRDAVISSLAAIEDEFELIVVVSHHDEFNDRFPARVEVTKQDGVSAAVLS